MKLATVGLVSFALGAALGIEGLMLSGLIWVPMGLLVRSFAKDTEAEAEAAKGRGEKAGISGGRFALSIAILLAIGLPSLAIGIFEIGIAEAEAEWRWLPIVIGGLITGLGLVSGLLVATGRALQAVPSAVGIPEEHLDLEVLDRLLAEGRITAAEHEQQRRRILDSV